MQYWYGLANDFAIVTRELWRRTQSLVRLTAPAELEGTRPSIRRLVNLWRVWWEWKRFRTTLRSYPIRLCVEASAACNLACPHCFTGAGEVSRPRVALSLEFFRQLLDELAPHLWQIEFHNWGEPLLNKQLPTMIAEASARGLSTLICTNFSVPFGEAQAERLVRSGLKIMGVSIDGASQSIYEQYRVRGDMERVLRNCRLMVDAKRRLGSTTPRIIWGFHVFGHNAHEREAASQLAREIGIEFHASRGRVFGPDWDPHERTIPHEHVQPIPCYTLYHTAVVYADGSMAPCRGSFYREDDVGRVAVNGGPGAGTFRQAWNGERYRLARRFFARRAGTPEEQRHICFGCPAAIDHERYLEFKDRGGNGAQWKPRFTSNERYNYFWDRRLVHRTPRP